MRAARERIERLIGRLMEDSERYEGRMIDDAGRFWRDYLTPYRRNIMIGLAITVVWAVHPYMLHLLSRYLVDYVLALGSAVEPPAEVRAERFRLYAALLFLVWTLFVAAHWSRSALVLSIGQKLVLNLRRDLNAKLHRLHVGYFESNETGKIISRVLEDVWVLREWSTNQVLMISAHMVRLLAGVVVLFAINWVLALLLTLSLPFYTIVMIRIRPLIRRLNISLRRLNAGMYALSQERISGIAVVKAFGAEGREKQSFALRMNNNVRLGMNVVRYQGWLTFLTGLITSLTGGLIPYLGVIFYKQGALSLGDVMVFVFSLPNIFFQVNALAGVYVQIQAVFVVLKRVLNVLDEQEAIPPGTATFEGMRGTIRFNHVSFAYPNQEKPALRDVSFSIPVGAKVALMGPSGAGKSSVFQLLCRFYDPQSGNVEVGGIDLADADPVSLRRHAVMVQQEPVIFSGSIAENIAYGRSEARPVEIMNAARQAELHEFIMALPAKYETEVGQNGITLSGGQKQRLALATALLTQPEILLLDDTTSALDAETEARIRATLDKVLRGRTSIIITQRIATARTCDFIIVLENGRIAQQGTHEKLSFEAGFYKNILEQQESG